MASRFYNDVGKDVVTLTTAKAAEFNAVNGDVNTGFEGVETEIDALSAVVAAADDTYLGFNRIINSDFSVNQRSYAANGTASIAEDEYGHDLMGPTGGSMIYRKETDGDITITSFTRSAGAGIVQLNHTNDDMVAGVGKDLTVSLYVVSLTLPVALYVADTLVYNITTTGWHDFQYTGLSGGDIGIGYTFSNSGTYSPAFRFNSWKVEENISRTTYSKPNYATELDKCLQYYSAPPSTGFSNPNLLINSDFVVNQRAYVSGAGLADGAYGHDLFQALGGALVYSKESDGDITIDSLTEVAAGIVELQQENDELTDAAGEELTVSLYVTSLTDSVYLFIDGVSADEIDSVGWYSYTYTAGTGGTVGLGHTFSAADVYYPAFRFNSWKVERGSTQTKYKIPEPVAEANRCYPYYDITTKRTTNLSTDLTYTVGEAGDYTSINDALTYISDKYYPIYINTGITVTINLLAGFIMAEQVVVSGLNLGWLKITGADASTTITRSALTTSVITNTFGTSYPAFAALNGGVLPTIAQLFVMDATGTATGRVGVSITGTSSAIIESACGVQDCGSNGLQVSASIVDAYECDFTGATSTGIVVTGSSIVNADSCDVSGCTLGAGVDLGVLNMSGADATGCGITAYFSGTIRADTIDCTGSNITVASGGIISAHGATGTLSQTANTISTDGIIFQ